MQMSISGFTSDYAEETLTAEQIKELTGDVLLEFGAPWCEHCEHCQLAQPAIQAALTENGELAHIKIYDGKGKALGRSFQIKLWPTLILLRDGHEVARLVRPSQTNEVDSLLAQ